MMQQNKDMNAMSDLTCCDYSTVMIEVRAMKISACNALAVKASDLMIAPK